MSGQLHQQQAGGTHTVTRKKRRGMIEKRRRDKINSSLSELRRLVPAAFEKQGSAKLEKAEILQMTVDFLRDLHERGLADSLLLSDKNKSDLQNATNAANIPDEHNQQQLQLQLQHPQQQQQSQHQHQQHNNHLDLFNNQQGQHNPLLEAGSGTVANQPQTTLQPHQPVSSHHYSAHHHHHHMSTAAAYHHHHHAHLSAPDMMTRTATGQYPAMSTVTHSHPSLLNLDNHRSHNPLGAYGTHHHAGAASINSYLAATGVKYELIEGDAQQIQPRLNQHAQPSMAH